MTPLRTAARRSILSTPVPARPTTRSFGQAAKTSAVTLVSDRMISASWFCSLEKKYVFIYNKFELINLRYLSVFHS